MAKILPFYCTRPNEQAVSRVAALPYDVYSREEARLVAAKEPLSFLNIDLPITQFSDDMAPDADEVYAKAGELLRARIADGTYLTEQQKCYFVYELIMDGRHQTGIVACASIDDYLGNVIKKHENTREKPEKDRIRHVDACNAQTGPIFLAYRSVPELARIIKQVKGTEKLYGFTSDDGITHNVWRIADPELLKAIGQGFAAVQQIYIADGHHRAAAAVKVGLMRREQKPDYDGTEEFNYFLCVLFDEEELMILPYNRLVRDLNGNTPEEFLAKVGERFSVERLGDKPYAPQQKGVFGMYLDRCWYKITVRQGGKESTDPVASLDVSMLQDQLLAPVLGIGDPRSDKRIDFVGGIRGLAELERRANGDMRVAFSMYPTSFEELFAVSDAGLLMPPKSTWFEPKLRSGIFIHDIGD